MFSTFKHFINLEMHLKQHFPFIVDSFWLHYLFMMFIFCKLDSPEEGQDTWSHFLTSRPCHHQQTEPWETHPELSELNRSTESPLQFQHPIHLQRETETWWQKIHSSEKQHIWQINSWFTHWVFLLHLPTCAQKLTQTQVTERESHDWSFVQVGGHAVGERQFFGQLVKHLRFLSSPTTRRISRFLLPSLWTHPATNTNIKGLCCQWLQMTHTGVLHLKSLWQYILHSTRLMENAAHPDQYSGWLCAYIPDTLHLPFSIENSCAPIPWPHGILLTYQIDVYFRIWADAVGHLLIFCLLFYEYCSNTACNTHRCTDLLQCHIVKTSPVIWSHNLSMRKSIIIHTSVWINTLLHLDGFDSLI